MSKLRSIAELRAFYGKGGKTKHHSELDFVPGAATDGRVSRTGLASDPAPLQVQHGSRVAGITAP